MKRIDRLFLMCLLSLMPPAVQAQSSGSVVDSKHNLSTSGTGQIKAVGETRVCIFCHSSHNTSVEGPLWNHQTSTASNFRTYQSPTLSSRPEQPSGATKLCLSCHDGTIAVGAIRGLSRPVTMQGVGGAGEIPTSKTSNFGMDLTGTHPVSIRYDQSSSLSVDHLRWPPIDPEKEVGPDASGLVQCTSCHDPHDDSKSDRYPFWRKKSFDEVCLTCHDF